MNYCRKCQSDYEKPGTCNCFAEKQADGVPAPFFPYSPWERPIYPGTSPWQNPLYVPSPTFYPTSPYRYDTTCGTGHHTQ